MVNEILALVIGYLLGSIPTAYIAGRIFGNRDVRKLGSGNVGGTTVYREIGALAGVVVAIIDLGKGVAAVTVTYWLLDVAPLYVMLAGFAAVIGHNWMLFLKFSGGKGMASTIGALTALLLIYGYWQGALIFFGIVLVPIAITRNIALATGLGLVFLPIYTGTVIHSWTATILALATGLLIGIRFLSTARAAWAKAGGTKGFIFDRWRREQSDN
jgi:glycerol-3-phosphate acyltransferase PlsY